MGQPIYIPGLNGTISVFLRATFEPDIVKGRPTHIGYPGDMTPGGPDESIFRYLEGKAWLSADAKNPRIGVIKIKLVLGSQDVYVTSWGENTQGAQWKFGGEGGKDGSK